ncbi:MAG: hydroxymethylpyrimidine/phosphomethylpyrimidine kinase [Nevskia sp.]|nr:hydroxymethylpyrimidine/phosphomethylpyrimidine kinase [Nevskia sp.]
MPPTVKPAPPAQRPRVLCLSGLDPSGGAGLQADIETIAALGGHAQGLISALTVQDSRNVQRVEAIAADLLDAQLRCLLADAQPQALKFGLLGSSAQLDMIQARLAPLQLPAVCDPVLRAGGGTEFDSVQFIPALRQQLLPWMTVITPNAAEARRLVPNAKTLADCARALLDDGCGHVLITGGDEATADVVNTWYARAAAPVAFRWPRWPETFHGAGCTLAAAIACRLALGEEVGSAIEIAQRWTQAALAQAFAIGRGRRIPLRRSAPARA